MKSTTQAISRQRLSLPWLVLARLGLLFTQRVASTTRFIPEHRQHAQALRQHPGSL